MTGSIGMSSKSGAKRKARHCPRNKLIAQRSLVFGIIAILLTISAASCMQPIIVYASVAGTIRGLIVTLVASLGLTNTNQATLDAMSNSQYLSQSYEVLLNDANAASALDAELSNLGVDVTSMTDLLSNDASVGTALTNAASEAGSSATIGAATAGQNIVASAEALAETGTLLPAAGGQALGVFNGLGFLAPIFFDQQVKSYQIQQAMKLMSNELPQTAGDNFTAACPDGATMYCFQNATTSQERVVIVPSGNYSCCVGSSNHSVCILAGSQSARIITKGGTTGGQLGQVGAATINAGNYNESFWNFDSSWSYLGTPTKTSNARTYLTSLRDGTIQETKHAPDVNTKDGNAQSNWNPTLNLYVTPSITPIINYNNDGSSTTNEYINNILDWDDYLDYANAVNSNTDDEDYTANGDLFDELIQTIIGDSTVNPTVAPTQAPIDNPIFNPDNVVQPTNPEQPDPNIKPINTHEQTEQMLDAMSTHGLTSRFPFCIPFDIYALFQRINTIEREAPYFDFTLNLGPAGIHHVEIDFSEFDTVAALARALELILFIIGLALGARKIIGE